MPDAYASMLRYAVGNATPIRLLVREGQGKPRVVEVETPYCVIGRARDCEVVLSDEKCAFRHGYLQIIGSRLAYIDLFSPTGTQWDGPPFQGWVNVAHRFRIGDTWIQVFDDGWSDDDLKAPTDYRPRHDSRPEYGVLPLVDLELLNSPARGTQWPINRIITLVGRDPKCRICCADENISKVHCAFLLLPTGLWVIDLLGKGGVKVGGEQVRSCLIAADVEVDIGPYKMKPAYRAAQQVYVPAVGHVGDAEKAEFLTRHNRLFLAEAYLDTLILSPVGNLPHVSYKEIHVESSRISELQSKHGFSNFIVDYSHAPILNSMIFDAIIGFCRAATGKVAMCHLSDDIRDSVKSMNLDRIWPCVESRAEAFSHIYAP
jgi:pSer/pThr/pTyr-binding forkhead associated (FHA) protein/anti-anti-sigma regulatory factor